MLVVVEDVPLEALPFAVDAAAFAGAHLVLLVPAGVLPPADLPADATVLAAPDGPDDGEFGTLVGVYAAALDRGMGPADAFRAATGGGELGGRPGRRRLRTTPPGGPAPARLAPGRRRRRGQGRMMGPSDAGRTRSGPSLRTLLTSGVTRRTRRARGRRAARAAPAARRVHAGSGPSHVAHDPGGMTTGIRSWISAMNSLGRVVTIVNVRSHSPVSSFLRPVHRPASASGRVPGVVDQHRLLPAAVAPPLVEAVDGHQAPMAPEGVTEHRRSS